MSLLTEASLVILPNAVEEGELFSIIPADGSGDMTAVRATTATLVNSERLIESVAINVPRLDYTNGSCPIILVEPQRTNLALNSQSFIPSWSTSPQTTATITSTTTIDPEGFTNAVRITNVSGGSTLGRVFTVVSGTTYTSSIWVRRVNGVGNVEFVDLNGSSTILNLTTEWKRFSITCTAVSIGRFYIRVNTVGDSIEVWGAQLEAGSNATSYIPTVASAVTRNADVISKTGISSLINGESGTLFLNSASLANDGTTKYFSINDGTTNNEIVFQYTSTSNTVGIRYLVGGVAQCDASVLIINALEFNKFAFTWQLNKFELWCNGIKVISDTSGNVTTGFNQINFRRSNGTIPFFSKVKSVALWKTALTDTQLSQLTTL